MGLRILAWSGVLFSILAACSSSDGTFRGGGGGTDGSVGGNGGGAGGADGSASGGANAGGGGASAGGGGATNTLPDGGVTCTTGQTQACYTGAPGTQNQGVCHAGTQYCVGGVFGPCVGEVTPSAESCNGLDDDCVNGVDDGLGTITCGTGACQQSVSACTNGKPTACNPGTPGTESCANNTDDDCDGIVNNGCGCVYVAPSGDDTSGTGQASAPFKTIAKGIAAAGTNNLPMEVCVASTAANCDPANPSTATYAEAITMRDGVSVYGGYRYNPTGPVWTRIGGTLALNDDGSATRTGCTTIINDTTDQGVVFPATVTSPTTLDGFTVNGQLNANAATAAITVISSMGAIINDDIVNGGGVGGGGNGLVTYGIHVDGTNGSATPLIKNNAIMGGTGKTSIGVRSYKSAPTIEDQCDNATSNAFDSAGRCNQYACGSNCWGATVRRFVRGRPYSGACNAFTTTTDTESDAIRLDDSPGATVARNAMCSGNSQGDSAGVRLTGSGANILIRANQVEAAGANTGSTNAVGVWMDPCGAASPWISNNFRISGGSRTLGARGDGIRAIGDCHPRIDSNVTIIGGEESSNNDAYGVYCAKDTTSGIASRCTVLNNTDVLGSSAGFPPVSAGVRCDGGGCARIQNNTRISARQGMNSYGIILDTTDTVVSQNGIDAGCGRTLSIGLLSIGSWARVENNVIGGTRWTTTAASSQCLANSANAANSYAVRAILGNGNSELELNSNDLFAMGTTTACTSRAIGFDIDTTRFAAPSGPQGIVRNNFLHAGLCNTSYGIEEQNAAADPRIVENNDIWSNACGTVSTVPCSATAATALYRDEAATNITAVTGVNGLTDITAGANLSVDPAFAGLVFAEVPVLGVGVPAAADVRTQTASPLIDVATSAGQPPVEDLYGNPRPAGAANDVGAYEHP